jgi:CRISPR/Cas system-associated protein Cas10 (large subunit of type III CRISPR-Cas system)
MSQPEEDDSSNRHLDGGRKGQWFAEIDKLLQLLRSTEFLGTIDPEHHYHYLKAFDDLSSPEAPNKEENGQSTKLSYKEERNRNLDEDIQKLRNILDTSKLGPEYQSRHLQTAMEIIEWHEQEALETRSPE